MQSTASIMDFSANAPPPPQMVQMLQRRPTMTGADVDAVLAGGVGRLFPSFFRSRVAFERQLIIFQKAMNTPSINPQNGEPVWGHNSAYNRPGTLHGRASTFNIHYSYHTWTLYVVDINDPSIVYAADFSGGRPARPMKPNDWAWKLYATGPAGAPPRPTKSDEYDPYGVCVYEGGCGGGVDPVELGGVMYPRPPWAHCRIRPPANKRVELEFLRDVAPSMHRIVKMV